MKVDARRAFVVVLRCKAPEEMCSGTLALRAARDRKHVHLKGTVARGEFEIPGGTSDSIEMVLNRKAGAALKVARVLKGTLVIKATRCRWEHANRGFALTLLAPPKPKRR